MSVGGLHFQFDGLWPRAVLAVAPERSSSEGDAAAGGRDVITRLHIEVEVGGGSEIGEGRQQALQEQLRGVGPDEEGDECEQEHDGSEGGAANDRLRVDYFVRANCLNTLRHVLLQSLLHDRGTGVRHRLRRPMNGDQGRKRFLKIGKSQVNRCTQFFRRKLSQQRPCKSEPGNGGCAEQYCGEQSAAGNPGQDEQIVEQAGKKQTCTENDACFRKSAGGGVQSYTPLTLIQKTLQTRDLSQDSGRHGALLVSVDQDNQQVELKVLRGP